jgi:hypothetical protein
MSDKNIEDILANLDRLLEEGIHEEHDEADDDPGMCLQPASSEPGLWVKDESKQAFDTPATDQEPDRTGEERKQKRRILLTEDMLVEDPSPYA